MGDAIIIYNFQLPASDTQTTDIDLDKPICLISYY